MIARPDKTAPPPLKLLSGMLIDVMTGEVVSDPNEPAEVQQMPQEEDSVSTDVNIVTRKRVAELPEAPALMNIVMIALGYTLWGLPASEIALALETSTDKIEQLMLSDAYQTAKTEVIGNLIESMQSDVRGRLVAQAPLALEKMIGMLKSKSESTRQAVAADILDRAGFTPQAIVNHRHSFDDELVMRVIKEDKSIAPIKTINMRVLDA